jgi:peptide chain release factor 1
MSGLVERKEDLEGRLRLALVPNDPNDEKNVIMEVRAGVGGDEAGLFAAEIYRMYLRYAQRMGWGTEVIDANQTGLGAIKEVVFQVEGGGAYSKLKHESGGHRVQRVPVTESSGRIHTSSATVAVLPEAEEVDVEIDPDDLQTDIFHSSGHGGQNVQKVATAVRITHLPTGIVATCQDERSQFKNREKAMSVLRSRLLAQEVERQQREVSQNRRSQVGTGDRSDRVRTYNYPQNRVTDHRVGLTSHDLEGVLQGNIDEFVDALADRERAVRLEEAAL